MVQPYFYSMKFLENSHIALGHHNELTILAGGSLNISLPSVRFESSSS